MGESMDGQSELEWNCGTCGQPQQGLATVIGAQAPDVWLHATAAEREAGELTGDMCELEVEGELHYFLRGHIEIPLIAPPARSLAGLFGSRSVKKALKRFRTIGMTRREPRCPVFGWLCNELPYDQSTISIATHVHNREPGVVPYIELDPSVDHPLVRDQATGISLHRLAEINSEVMGYNTLDARSRFRPSEGSAAGRYPNGTNSPKSDLDSTIATLRPRSWPTICSTVRTSRSWHRSARSRTKIRSSSLITGKVLIGPT